MQPAAAYVVVAHEAEYLGFSRVAVVGRHVQNFVNIAHEGGTVQPGRRIAAGIAAKGLRLVCAIGVAAAFGAVLFVALDEFFAEITVCHGCFFRPAVRDGLVFGSRKAAASIRLSRLRVANPFAVFVVIARRIELSSRHESSIHGTMIATKTIRVARWTR